jgi:hypothetical protein
MWTSEYSEERNEFMNNIIKQIITRLADRSSRRGFFSTMGKAALGAAALITGQGFFAQAAEAATPPLHCCTVSGGATACATTSCPSGTKIFYTWHCGHNNDHDTGDYYICHDCNNILTGKHVCVYATSHT